MKLAWVVLVCCAIVAIGFSSAFAQATEPACSLQTLKGSYGLTYTGEIIGSGPIGVIARITYDGAGHLKQHDKVIGNGVPSVGEETGTYTVRADCTGTETINFQGGFVLNLEFVLDDNAREIRAVSQTLNVNTTVTGRKQFVP